MSKDNFQWDDSLVKEILCRHISYKGLELHSFVESFKASHQPIPKMSREMFSTEPRGNHFGFDEPQEPEFNPKVGVAFYDEQGKRIGAAMQEPSKPEKDWEIVTKYYEKLNYIHTPNEYCEEDKCKIHSVRRLSDGEVFSVGDEVVHKTDGMINVSKILKFIIPEAIENKMWFEFIEGENYCQDLANFNKLPPQPKPLFTTEDGVDIHEGDCFHALQKATFHSMRCNYPMDKPDQWRTFANKIKMEEYILMNKPCLSFSDVCNLDHSYPHDSLFFSKERLKQLANNKINNQ